MPIRPRSIGALAVVAALAAALPGTGRAEGDVLAADVLARSRARYAAARDLQASFEGFSAVFGQRIPVGGSIAFLANHAFRQEIRSGDDDRRLVTVREGPRLRSWKVRRGEVTVLSDRTVTGPVKVPLLPAFDIYDEATIALTEVRRVPGRPAVYVIEARFREPGDPFAAARLGIEDGTWIIRTLDLLEAGGETAMALEFREVKIDEGLPEGTFAPPKGD